MAVVGGAGLTNPHKRTVSTAQHASSASSSNSHVRVGGAGLSQSHSNLSSSQTPYASSHLSQIPSSATNSNPLASGRASPSGQGASSTSSISSPSKDNNRIREWTFPKKSKTSPACSPKPNVSPPSSPVLSATRQLTGIPSSITTTGPSGIANASPGSSALSNARVRASKRSSAATRTSQVFYSLAFVASLVVFFSALSGRGYTPPATVVPTDRMPPPKPFEPPPPPQGAAGVVVERDPLAETLQDGAPMQREANRQENELRNAWSAHDDDDDDDDDDDGPPPADIHQPVGDKSHDRGRDFVRASPDDADLDDSRAHEHPPNHPRPLFQAHPDLHPVGNNEAEKGGSHAHRDPELVVERWAKQSRQRAAAAAADRRPAPAEVHDGDEHDVQDDEEDVFVIDQAKAGGVKKAVDTAEEDYDYTSNEESEVLHEEEEAEGEGEELVGGDVDAVETADQEEYLDDDDTEFDDTAEADDEDVYVVDEGDEDEEDVEEEDEEEIGEEHEGQAGQDASRHRHGHYRARRPPSVEDLREAKAEIARRRENREDQRARWLANVRQGRQGGRVAVS